MFFWLFCLYVVVDVANLLFAMEERVAQCGVKLRSAFAAKFRHAHFVRQRRLVRADTAQRVVDVANRNDLRRERDFVRNNFV